MQVETNITLKDYTNNFVGDNTNCNELKTSIVSGNQNTTRRSSCDNESMHRSLQDASSLTTNRKNSTPSNSYNTSSSLGNLSFINIVGLPYHPRQSSVPSTTTLRNQVGSNSSIFPIHFRNASESSAVPSRPPRSNSEVIVNNINIENIDVRRAPIVPLKGHTLGDLARIESSINSNIRVSRSNGQLSNIRYNLTPETKKDSSTATQNVHQISQLSQKCDNKTTDNVSNINVNFYRAVPMNIISSVPTIKCLNTQSAKNVSNVQIMPLSDTSIDQNSCCASSNPCTTSITSSQVTVHNGQPPTQVMGSPITETISSVYLLGRPALPERTFTSTEAQTDDISLSVPEVTDKDRRRRAKRERKLHRRPNQPNSRTTGEISTQTNNGSNATSIPDILDNHLPPPYVPHLDSFSRTVPISNIHPVPPRNIPNLGMIPPPVGVPPPQVLRGMVPTPIVPNMLPQPRPRNTFQNVVPNSVGFPTPNILSGQVPLVQNIPDGNSGLRFALPVGQLRRDHFAEETPKSCCGVLTWKPGSFKWFLASLVILAVGLVLAGLAVGTMKPVGRDPFTAAGTIIGSGVLLVTMSVIAWRLASQTGTSCSACSTMLGIGSLESIDVCTRRFVPRLPPTYGRPHHPYAAMMYPEFQYRPPPPTYQASMQEYRLRLLLIDRGNTPQIHNGVQSAVSPPPTYRSHTGSLIRDSLYGRNDVAWSEYSCPPSYRSQTYSSRLGTIQDSVSIHTRDPSMSSTDRTNENIVEVVNIQRSTEGSSALEEVNLDTKVDQDSSSYKIILDDCGDNFDNDKEGNLVTIVQTDDNSPVILTVSGNSESENNSSNNDKSQNEIQILAHL